MVTIGTVEIRGAFALAPMAGVTDFAFRKLCRDNGAALTVSEMVSARALCYRDAKTKELLYMPPDEHPASVQIFGHEPEILAEAAREALELSGADILDVNMGCPVGKVVTSGDGSALMRDPELAGRIVEAVVKAVSVPVTVKFRKGLDTSTPWSSRASARAPGPPPLRSTGARARRCTPGAPTGTSSATPPPR